MNRLGAECAACGFIVRVLSRGWLGQIVMWGGDWCLVPWR